MERSQLTRRCAWCGRVKLGDSWIVDRRPDTDDCTHGICAECLAKLVMAELPMGS